MAFNLESRFPKAPKYVTLLDPGAYQISDTDTKKWNKIAFNSSTPRNIRNEKKLWTHAIYNPEYRKKIPNCPSMMSRQPRFPYESYTKFDLVEEFLCNCGVDNVCTCSMKTELVDSVKCQGKIPKRIFKGLTLQSAVSADYQSEPPVSKSININTTGFNGFSTDFYRGWKWSKWTSPRLKYSIDQSPGPGYYDIEKEPDKTKLCAEQCRFHKRKKSKQLRFIEMIQERNIIEGRPGPTDYDPKEIKAGEQNITFGKCVRFCKSSTEIRPGPADHSLRRDFDLIENNVVCHAKLPNPAPFNVRADRFKSRKDDGPCAATYSPKPISCNFTKCTAVPFGSSASRFKDQFESDQEDQSAIDDETNELKSNVPQLSSNFKSKTVRFKPLVKKKDEPSPADLGPVVNKMLYRSLPLQQMAPFFSSEGRFMPWRNWISIFGNVKTPGPGYYDVTNYSKKNIAVHHGPLSRSLRFKVPVDRTPAPNAYIVGGGIETILRSHNHRLKENTTSHQALFSKEPAPFQLSLEERETLLINKSINLLSVDDNFQN
ncbi:uncharacterized protein LOC114246905 [Bombyx mandarina]|uniref:Uncharacterized protein LOC114246905 n=1 Tax=Bombyx mandarina TaxID=7092 RepID=A0A6J2K189_BOMMA|nr:uncharacterized protein LOC114246905 [Bombyx mandarina]